MKPLVSLLAVVLVLLVAIGVILAVREPVQPPDIPETPAGDGGAAEPLVAEKVENPHELMIGPWPFESFTQDLRELRHPEFEESDKRPEELLAEVAIKVEENPLTIRLEQTTAKEVVKILHDHYAQFGLLVTDLDLPMPDTKFDIFLTDATAWQVIAQVTEKTEGLVKDFMTQDGICVGTLQAIQEFQIRTRKGVAERRAARDRESPLLQREFRPDFQGALIGNVARMIRGSAGVEVVIGPSVWSEGKKLTWRTEEPIPLGKVMDRLAKEFDAVYRVRADRLFLFKH